MDYCTLEFQFLILQAHIKGHIRPEIGKFLFSKWTFCHKLEEHSNLFSSPFSPAQHNYRERGVFQHVAHLLGTGI